MGLLLLLTFSAGALAQAIWYEDNSFARRGGLPDDFVRSLLNRMDLTIIDHVPRGHVGRQDIYVAKH